MRRTFLTRWMAALGLWVFRTRVVLSDDATNAIVNGRAIVCANHVSLLDGVLIAFASPAPLVFGVNAAYARYGRFSRWGLALMSRLGFGAVVPLDLAMPFGIRKLRVALDRGYSVMVFPEGAISPNGRPQPEHGGLRWLVSRTGAHIVRLEIRGAETSRLFSKSGRQWWPRIDISSDAAPASRRALNDAVDEKQQA
uniref:lysophospholipid acyltransferase family protein n=1 Tax=Burkholderia arboris TaxID=488730 RepID=UPI003BEF167E